MADTEDEKVAVTADENAITDEEKDTAQGVLADGEGEEDAELVQGMRKRKPYDTYAAALVEFGEEGATYAKHLAEAPFEEFRAGMRDIGYPVLGEDEPKGLGHGHGSEAISHYMPRLANAALCLRYPFLVPRSRWSGNVIWYSEIDAAMYDESRISLGRTDAFKTTELDALPVGWVARFGLQLCEDLKAAVCSSKDVENPLDYYRIEQAKEKYGQLRWYSAGVPRDAYDAEMDVVSLYEDISARTCIVCGGEDRVRVSGGWISYECYGCRAAGARGDALSDESVLARYNELAESGELARLVDGQSDEWKQKAFGDDGVPSEWKQEESFWRLPWDVRDIVRKDILDEHSAAVGTLEDDRIHVTYEYRPDQKKPVRHETDLFAWADGRGLLAADLARSIDRMRRLCDGDTNQPLPRDDDDKWDPFAGFGGDDADGTKEEQAVEPTE